MIAKDFEDLKIFQGARSLYKKIYPLTKRGEWRYDSRFVQQIRAASGSIMDNIAEGFERSGNKEFINFLYIAKGSCGEVRSQVTRAFDSGYISQEEYNDIYGDCRRLSAAIMNFISSLRESDVTGPKYK